MKRLAVLVIFVALAAVADVRAGEGNKGAGRPERSASGIPPVDAAAADHAKYWYITYLDKVVGLSDEQKKSMIGIVQTRNKAMWDYQMQNARRLRAAGNALISAFRSMDGDTIAKAQSQYQELYTPLHQLMRESQDELMQLLTPEQRTRLDEFKVLKAIEAMAAPVQLSEDQIRRIKTAWPKAGDQTADGAACDQIIQQVLTPDQKTAVAKHRALSFVKATFGRAELTEEQLQRAEVVASELALDTSVTPEEVHRKLSDEIRALLTPQQEEAMKKPWPWNRGGPGGWSPRGTPPGSQFEGPAEKETE